MKSLASFRTVAAALVGFGVLGAASAAHARTDVVLSVGMPAYVEQAPVYVAPRPTYVAPQPVYVAPRPVYAPQPVYVESRPAYRWYGDGDRWEHERMREAQWRHWQWERMHGERAAWGDRRGY